MAGDGGDRDRRCNADEDQQRRHQRAAAHPGDARIAYERRSNSQALFRVRRPTAADRLRILKEMPWWIRNVFVKVLLRLRLRPVARLFGHDSPYDPF